MSIYYDKTQGRFIFKLDGGNDMTQKEYLEWKNKNCVTTGYESEYEAASRDFRKAEYTRWSEFMRQVYRIDDSTTQLKLYNQMKDWERHYAGTDYTKYSHGRLYRNDIQKVIFNNPATIVFWKDGTKTVVKCGPDDTYDAEKGLAMAICKKVYGNENFFHKIFKHWLPEEDKE